MCYVVAACLVVWLFSRLVRFGIVLFLAFVASVRTVARCWFVDVYCLCLFTCCVACFAYT